MLLIIFNSLDLNSDFIDEKNGAAAYMKTHIFMSMWNESEGPG